MHTLPGLLTDFKIRMHPTKHCRPNDVAIERLRFLTFMTPPAMLSICYLATQGYLDSPVSVRQETFREGCASISEQLTCPCKTGRFLLCYHEGCFDYSLFVC